MGRAMIIALFKKECPLTVSNYRPISLLCVFSKIIEKLMYKRLYNFLELHNVLYDYQFGFRNKHSTDHALICLTKKLSTHLDQGNVGCGIFVDLEKAFDTGTVNHSIS